MESFEARLLKITYQFQDDFVQALNTKFIGNPSSRRFGIIRDALTAATNGLTVTDGPKYYYQRSDFFEGLDLESEAVGQLVLEAYLNFAAGTHNCTSSKKLTTISGSPFAYDSLGAPARPSVGIVFHMDVIDVFSKKLGRSVERDAIKTASISYLPDNGEVITDGHFTKRFGLMAKSDMGIDMADFCVTENNDPGVNALMSDGDKVLKGRVFDVRSGMGKIYELNIDVENGEAVRNLGEILQGKKEPSRMHLVRENSHPPADGNTSKGRRL